MSELQLGLLLIGVAAVAGVLVYNRVQERAARRQAERAFGSSHADVLMQEPGARKEPALAAQARRPELQAEAMPDERVDYVVKLDAPEQISIAMLLELWAPLERRFAGRGLLAATDGSGWRRVVPGESRECIGMRAGLQLLGRDGVIADAELLEFRSQVETLGAKIGATLAAPEMRDALEAARELDRVCADADIQVALHVIGVAPQEAPLAGEHPFQVEARADGLTLSLDLPRTPDPARAYEAMARAGTQLAASLGGQLVDDNGRALDAHALAAIGAQLDAVRQTLAARGIEPGSPLALRLFS